jgi:PAS domain-containing protein
MFNNESKKVTSIFDAMVDGVYVIDEDYNLEYMNDIMCEDFGEGVGLKCHQVIQGKGRTCPWCRAGEVFAGKTIRWEYGIKKTGRIYDLIEFPLKSSDERISKVSIFRDITQRKRREEELKSSEEDYKRLFEQVVVGAYRSSKEGKFLDANQALIDMLDYENKEEFIEIDITKDLYLRPEDRRKLQEMIERDRYVRD